jgi:hypothetical protein
VLQGRRAFDEIGLAAAPQVRLASLVHDLHRNNARGGL